MPNGLADQLVLGIDAGGTKTVAWLATAEGRRLGQGLAGSGNPYAIGFEQTYAILNTAIAQAFAEANQVRRPIAALSIGMAGVGRPEDAQKIIDWARGEQVAERISVVNDALPVIAAGTPEGSGVALIAGTGSIAVAIAADGRQARAGGWGYLFGDEGSAYAIALEGLRMVGQSADTRQPPTSLVPRFLEHLNLKEPAELIKTIYRPEMDRPAIASLAPVVLDAAEAGDSIAQRCMEGAAESLARMAAAAARQVQMQNFPVAMAGGLLIRSTWYRDLVTNKLRREGAAGAEVVADPVAGAVTLACRLLRG